MKNYWSLICFLFLASFISAQNNAELRVMTYNIRFAGSADDEANNSWNSRKDLVAEVIRFNKADIFGLQEALHSQIVDIKNSFPKYNWVGVGREDGKEGGEYSPIFFNTEKYKLIHTSTFWLSETPDSVSKGWDAAFKRVVTWSEFTFLSSGQKFFVFNTHFDHIGESARINSAKLILKKIKEIAGDNPTILIGDFNTKSDSPPYSILTNGIDGEKRFYLNDAETVNSNIHYGSHITFNGFGNDIQPGNKIDFIFVNDKVKVKEHGVISETFDGKYPSDHFSVIAEVEIE
ncbi:MAG: endonuclease/exonuclease/phosphatase family protein [Ignavibacteriales bacterium]|nr:endonuclease/exonuclease/phosphatase family protein [Ignavibacteriales bacterium]